MSLQTKSGYTIVKKQSKDISYNNRLREQARKQANYNGFFQKCKVLNVSYSNYLYEFNMEYIPGKTVAEYMRDIRIVDIYKIVDLFFLDVLKEYRYDVDAKYVFLKKIKSLKVNIKDSSKLYNKCFELLENHSWNYMFKSKCHGDMTLENMIIYNGEIYLIDFLDSFYNSWLLDFAKILQDTDIYWSYRWEEQLDVNLKIRLLILKELMIEGLLTFPDGKYLLKEVYYILLLNLMRIVPYLSDEKTKDFINSKLKYLYDYILNMNLEEN